MFAAKIFFEIIKVKVIELGFVGNTLKSHVVHVRTKPFP